MSADSTGKSSVTVTYAKVPDFTGQTVPVAKAWAAEKGIPVEVIGDPENQIIGQNKKTPLGLKTGEFAETLILETSLNKKANFNILLWAAGGVLLTLMMAGKKG